MSSVIAVDLKHYRHRPGIRYCTDLMIDWPQYLTIICFYLISCIIKLTGMPQTHPIDKTCTRANKISQAFVRHDVFYVNRLLWR